MKRRIFSGISFLIVVVFCSGLFSGFAMPSGKESTSSNLIAATSNLAPFTAPDPNAPDAEPVLGLSRNQSLTLGRSVTAMPKSYNTPDNSGYNVSNQYLVSNFSHPLGRPYAVISVDTLNEGGDMQRMTNITPAPGLATAEQAFGFIAGDKPSYNGRTVELKLHYSIPRTENLAYGWSLNEDSWKEPVNGHQLGVVGRGALILERSLDGKDWTRTNPFSGDPGNTFSTVDFATHFAPSEHNGRSYTVQRLVDVLDKDGKPVYIKDKDGKDVVKKEYKSTTAYNKLTIYSPDGNDLVNGVYLRVTFAYEIRNGNQFRNMVEQTSFFIANNSGEIAFRNLVFENYDSETEDKTPDEDIVAMSELLQMAGSIKDGHASNEGFTLNYLGNTSYHVEYRHNFVPGTIMGRTKAVDGQLFTNPGKYDFRIKTPLGMFRYQTIFINERGISQNLRTYFGQKDATLTTDGELGLITSDSRRILSSADPIPVYHVGQTFWQTRAVSLFQMPLVGEIVNETLHKDHPDKTIYVGGQFAPIGNDYETDIRRPFGGQLTHPGKYTATFANNPDFFSGAFSGDVYRFVFEFLVIDLDDIGPSLNAELLGQHIGVNNFAAGYFGVTVQGAGQGKVTFAHSNYSSAFNTAYDYMRSLVKPNGTGGWTFQGKDYPNQFTVLEAISDAAELIIEKRYFDLSNPASYLTVEDATDDILSLKLDHDIVVFADTWEAGNAVKGEPFLNDRIFNFIDEDGVIRKHRVPVRFIQVAEFESTSIVVEHELTKRRLQVPYDVGVQTLMDEAGMPTGRYKIIEKNKFGDVTEYYAIYVRPGEVQTTITASRLMSGIVTEHPLLSLAHNNNPINANSFIIRSAENKLDPYGILKIERAGDSNFTQIFQLDEVKDIILDEEGSYTITVVDRLGNTARFPVNIYVAQKVYTLTLMDGDKVIQSAPTFGGQSVKLPSLENTAIQRFIGWRDLQGNLYEGTYTFNATQNIFLTSDWEYLKTTVEIYDGQKLETHTTQPNATIVLPIVSKQGLELFGFAYTQPDENVRFYRWQITSVPNVQTMRLDAMWVDRNQTFEVKASPITRSFNAVELPTPTREGFIFAGWLEQTDNISGIIHNNEIVADKDLTLFALWLADPDYIAEKAETQSLLSAFFGTLGSVAPPIGLGFLALLLMLLLINRLRRVQFSPKARLAHAANGSTEGVSRTVKETHSQVILQTNDVSPQKGTSLADSIKSKETGGILPNWITSAFSKRQRNFARLLVVGLCFVMTAILIVTASDRLLYELKFSRDVRHAEQEVRRQLDIASAERLAERTARQAEIDRRNEFIATTTQAFNNPQDSIFASDEVISEFEISDEEAFLYTLIYFDLLNMGYDVFPAFAIVGNYKIRGFGYTSYSEAFESKNENDEKLYFSTGFVALLGEKNISTDNVLVGVEIAPVLEESETLDYSYVLAFEEEYGFAHYIAFDKYVRYKVSNYRITVDRQLNETIFYDITLGFLFNYDLGRPVYDPDLGKEFSPNGFSLNEAVNYALVHDSYRSFIYEQTNNGISVDTVSMMYINMNALADVMTMNQPESFLGLSADELYYIQANLPDTHFYYVDADGEIQMLELPPDPPKKASIWERIWTAVIVAAVVAIAIVVVVATCGAAAPILIGAAVGFGVELIMQVVIGGTPLSEVDWRKVAVSTVAGALAAIPGIGWVGAGLIMGGAQAAMAWLDGGDLMDCLLAFGIGFATGAAIHFASKGLQKLSSKIADKLGKCFVVGTAILTATGVVAIENIKAGDMVYSYNELTRMTEIRPVTQVFRSVHTELTHVQTVDGQTISSSIDHAYFVMNRNAWIPANNLRAGDILLTVNGKKVVVEEVQHELLERPQTLYNFEVEGNHNYFVAQKVEAGRDEFVLVHNFCVKKVGTNVHGNSLKTTKPAETYVLVDKASGKTMKIGETTRGVKRYTNKFYEKNGVEMITIAKGSKAEMHKLQNQFLNDYYRVHGNKLPPFNKTFW